MPPELSSLSDSLGPLSSSVQLSVQNLALNLGFGLLLGLLTAWHYAKFGRAMCNRTALARVLVVVVLITTLVISVVKSQLALSLGMVGALSIVRFRTPIKEPEELAYLFLTIAAGIGLGADQWKATVPAVLVILIVTAIYAKLGDRSRRSNLYLNIEVPTDADSPRLCEEVATTVSREASDVNLRRMDVSEHLLQATFFVDCRDDRQLFDLMEALRGRFPEASVSFVDQSPSLDA